MCARTRNGLWDVDETARKLVSCRTGDGVATIQVRMMAVKPVSGSAVDRSFGPQVLLAGDLSFILHGSLLLVLNTSSAAAVSVLTVYTQKTSLLCT